MPPPNNNIYDPLRALALTNPLVLYVNYGEYENIATSVSSHATDALIWTCYGSPISNGRRGHFTNADAWFRDFSCKRKVRVLILENRSQYKEYVNPQGDKVKEKHDFEIAAKTNGTLLYTTKGHIRQHLGCSVVRSLDIGYVASGNEKIIFFSNFRAKERNVPGTKRHVGLFRYDTNLDFGDSEATAIFANHKLHGRLINAVMDRERSWCSDTQVLAPPLLPIAMRQMPVVIGSLLWYIIRLSLPGIFGKAGNALGRMFFDRKE